MPTRRDFLIRAAAAGLPSIVSSGIAGPASAVVTSNARENNWDQGRVQHLLPTVNHDRLLIKASFDQPLLTTPELHVGTNRVRGQRNAASGDFWQFDASGLKPEPINCHSSDPVAVRFANHGRSRLFLRPTPCRPVCAS
jgi:hypothetical protein